MFRFLNSFEVPLGRDEEFVARWEEVNTYMVSKPGYLGHRLHRSLAPDVRYRFVNYVAWESAEHCRAAHDEGFLALARRPEMAAFPSSPAGYEVVHSAGAVG